MVRSARFLPFLQTHTEQDETALVTIITFFGPLPITHQFRSHLPLVRTGCKDPGLVAKRKSRNPFFVTPDYKWTNPLLSELLSFCSEEDAGIFEGELPWNAATN